MTNSTALIIVGPIIAALSIIAPQMMRFRILVLRKFKFNWLANLHERYFKGFVIGIRIILIALGLYVTIIGIRGL